jgi:uncharacterized RDD family membrane protein YckC
MNFFFLKKDAAKSDYSFVVNGDIPSKMLPEAVASTNFKLNLTNILKRKTENNGHQAVVQPISAPISQRVQAWLIDISILFTLIGFYTTALWVEVGGLLAIPFILPLCYMFYAWLWESSSFHATPGKLALNLKVVNRQGQSLSPFASTLRPLIPIVCFIGGPILLASAQFTAFWFTLFTIAIAYNPLKKSGTAPIDRLFGRFIITNEPANSADTTTKSQLTEYLTKQNPRYARPDKRLLAFLIDEFILVLILLLPINLIMMGFNIAKRFTPSLLESFSHASFWCFTGLTLLLISGIFAQAILYLCGFEASPWQATPGKRLLGLKVVDGKGNRLSFWSCLSKQFVQILFFVLMVTLPLPLFIRLCPIDGQFVQNQLLQIASQIDNSTWHRIFVEFAQSWIVFSGALCLTLIYMLVCFGAPLFASGTQTFFDRFTQRYVVETIQTISPEIEPVTGQRKKELIDFVIPFILCAYLILWSLISYLNLGKPNDARVCNYTGSVVYATHNLPTGTKLSSTDIRIEPIGKLRTPLGSLSPDCAISAVLTKPIKSGEIISYDSTIKEPDEPKNGLYFCGSVWKPRKNDAGRKETESWYLEKRLMKILWN